MAVASIPKQKHVQTDRPRYVYHPSFQDAAAKHSLASTNAAEKVPTTEEPHLPDEMTRDCARRMHYAAYRWEIAATAQERDLWVHRYFALRDTIVLGNRKLIFRAVQKWKSVNYQAEDLASECHIVLIRVVASYNPWLGIRFSTFAFTCLMRALSRLWSKLTTDQKRHPVFWDQLTDADVSDWCDSPTPNRWEPLEQYFRKDHVLLSQREKIVLERRYGLGNPTARTTLEAVGRDLGLSKERVRQLEKTALEKLRQALNDRAE